MAGAIIVMILEVSLGPVIVYFIYRITFTIQTYAVSLAAKTRDLRKEKKRLVDWPLYMYAHLTSL